MSTPAVISRVDNKAMMTTSPKTSPVLTSTATTIVEDVLPPIEEVAPIVHDIKLLPPQRSVSTLSMTGAEEEEGGGGTQEAMMTSTPSPSIAEVSDDNLSIASERSLASVLNVEPYDPEKDFDYDRPLIFGHRGAPYHDPENTIPSFETSVELGCDGVELDVFLLKCGTLVVFHGGGSDKNPGCLKDYCGVRGNIMDYTLEEARKLSFTRKGKVFKQFPEEKLRDVSIPTLEEVLEVAKRREITVKVELKGPGTVEPVLELVERMDMVNQCHFVSFYHDRLARLRELRPQRNPDGTHKYRTGALFREPPADFVERAKAIDASEVVLRYDTCSKDRVERIHAAGMVSMAWFRNPLTMKKDSEERFDDVGNEDEAMYHAVLRTGVQAVIVNKPDVVLDLVEDDSSDEEKKTDTSAA